MKRQFLHFALSLIIIYLGGSALDLAGAASQPSAGNGTHFCGVIDRPPDKQQSDQFPNRHYARTFAANLNVGEPRTVRLIYFIPNDWSYRADVVQKMKDTIRTVQTFYAEQMEAHGYGKITFRVETDPQGEPMVHRVEGQYPFSHYDNTLGDAVFDELEQTFNLDTNIYFIVLGTDALRQGNGVPVGGVAGQWAKNGGALLVPNGFSWDTVAHELGHTFGLEHDFRNNVYIMSYGGGQHRSLSACAAEFLSVHSYFNLDTPIEEGEQPTIELISPRTYPAGSMSVPVRVQVSDSDGLHQVILHTLSSLQLCRKLAGEKNAIVEFEYSSGFFRDSFMLVYTSLSDSATHPMYVEAVDTDGNVSNTFFTLAESSPHHIATLEGHTASVRSLSFSPDEILASGSEDGTIILWDMVARQNIATLEGHRYWVTSVAFSPNGMLASGSWDGTVRLWDVETRQHITTIKNHPLRWIHAVSFSPDGGTLAWGTSSGEIKLWDVVTEVNIGTLTHGDHVFSVSFSDAGTLASGGAGRTVKLWDVETRQHITTIESHPPPWIYAVSFSPDGGTLAWGTSSGEIKLWDVVTEVNIGTLTHGSTVSSVSFSPDVGTLASGGWRGKVKLWEMTTRANFANLPHTSGVDSVSFSPDGKFLASGTWDGAIELWDVSMLMEVRLEALTEIDISDPNLRAVTSETIGLPPNTSILRGHLQALTGLEARNANISDLTGLEGATNLITLHLHNNSISDVSPLAGLTQLNTLSLYNNSISDASPLAGLINLKYLYLHNNSISDVSSLAGLTQLNTLSLYNNSISDVSPLLGLNQTGTRLYLDRNPLSYPSLNTHIPTLQAKGIEVRFDNRTPTTLVKISGTEQQATVNAALAQPFVVEVRDQHNRAFSEVPVTFTVTAGGGTLSVTNTTTDENGRAQSTLTLGPNPGTNTVEVSAAEIKTPVTFNAVPAAFRLSVPAGISLIHVPLKVTTVNGMAKPITSISDLYDALGGADTVNLLGTHDPKTQRWFSYADASDKGTTDDPPLTDDKGIIASMKVPVEVRLRGDALGTNGHSSITLLPGLNLVGMPLADSRIARVSDLFALKGIGGNVSAITVSANGRLKTVRQVGDEGDISITGGQSFFLRAQEATTVVISGSGWYNTAAKVAAPSVVMKGIEVRDTTPILAVRGAIVDEGTCTNRGDFRVIVKNLSAGRAVSTFIGDEDFLQSKVGLNSNLSGAVGYRLTVVDTGMGRAARIEDILEISAQSPNPLIGVQPFQYVVTAADVKRNRIQLSDLVAYEIPAKTELLANYPNPFNPETWIPYRLAADAFVTLTIYDPSGQVVRTLDVGHQIAAVYESRSKAVYWDGRNDVGEQVASGVYFYHLSAGDYSATRKMVILK